MEYVLCFCCLFIIILSCVVCHVKVKTTLLSKTNALAECECQRANQDYDNTE